MRIGCCLNMLGNEKDRAGIQYIKDAAEAGFAYVEPPLAEFAAMDEEKLCQVEGLLEETQIRVEAFCNFFPASLRLTGPEAQDSQIDAYMERALAVAARFGAKYTVFGSGAARMTPEGFPKEGAYGQLVDVTRRMADIAAEYGIVIAIEPLNRGECNIIRTFREGCMLAKDTGKANVRALADYYHFTLEKDSIEDLASLGKTYLCHVHFAEAEKRSYPRKVRPSYVEFIRGLKAAGYEGRISCEGYSKNFLAEGKTAVSLLKEICRTVYQEE